jgi:hypothetical protein
MIKIGSSNGRKYREPVTVDTVPQDRARADLCIIRAAGICDRTWFIIRFSETTDNHQCGFSLP